MPDDNSLYQLVTNPARIEGATGSLYHFSINTLDQNSGSDGIIRPISNPELLNNWHAEPVIDVVAFM